MERLSQNLQAILQRNGSDLETLLKSYKVSRVEELSLQDLQNISRREGVDWENLLLYNHTVDKKKLKDIKLIILDVDGVLTDGGMYFTENGDQFKKYNTNDGLAIRSLHKKGIVDFGIISSGFKIKMVKERADLLMINHFYVGREPKLKILKDWCDKLKIDLSQVVMIGDDINDLEVMKNVGFSVAPASAVPVIKKQADLVLTKKGGTGCVREFIDFYLLENPLEDK